MKVSVVGAGQAGRSAAAEAAQDGAEVTLFDSLASPLPDWTRWPDLISEGERGLEGMTPRVPDVELALGTAVVEVGNGSARRGDGAKLAFDAFVLALGSEFLPPALEGRRKPGVAVLDSPAQYVRLGDMAGSEENPVVTGEGWRGAEVTERLLKGAGSAHFAPSSWEPPAPGGPALEAVLRAGADQGVSIAPGPVSRALGPEAVEAAVCGGSVVATGLVAVAPVRRPRAIRSPAEAAEGGALAVSLEMRTSAPGVLAAGATARPKGSPSGAGLAREQAASGRVAGANSAGRVAALSPVRAVRRGAFGVRWSAFYFAGRASEAQGLSELKPDERTACAVFFDRGSGRVSRIELVEDARGRDLTAPAFGDRPSLKSLAYDGSADSIDISLVSDTARQGLREWSGY